MGFVSLVFRFALSYVFLAAGTSKLLRPDDFEDAIVNYQLLPARLVAPIARLIPLVEVGLGAAVGFGFATTWASGLLAAVLMAFSIAVSINLLRGRSIDCGCSTSTAPRKITWRTIGRNGVLVAGARTASLNWPHFKREVMI